MTAADATAREAMELVRSRVAPYWGDAAFEQVLEMADRVPRSVSSHFGIEAHLTEPHRLDFGFSLTHPKLIARPELATALGADPEILGEIASAITAQRPGLSDAVSGAWIEIDTSRGVALAGLGGSLADADQRDPRAIIHFLESIGGPLGPAARTAIEKLHDPTYGVASTQIGTFVGRSGAPARLISFAPTTDALIAGLEGAGWQPGALAETLELAGDSIKFAGCAVDVHPEYGVTPRVAVELYPKDGHAGDLMERVALAAGADPALCAAAVDYTATIPLDSLAVARLKMHHIKVDVAPDGISVPKAYLSLRVVLAPRGLVQAIAES